MTDPAATMRRAADHIRRLGVDVVYDRLADWLDDAANEAEQVGTSPHAERVAAAILGLDDPWPDAKRPHRPDQDALAERHVIHYRVCGCLGDSSTCCNPACPCHQPETEAAVTHVEGVPQ